MDDNEKVEHIEAAIFEALAEMDSSEIHPAHVIAAVTAVAVKLAWASLGDKTALRATLATMVDDYATQAEFGPMVSQ